MFRQIWCVPLLIAGVSLSGCGGGPPEPKRYPVSGTVNRDGMPLAEGTIIFRSPAEGAIDSLEIKAGKFEGKAQAGERRVEINAYRVENVDKDGMKSEEDKSQVKAEISPGAGQTIEGEAKKEAQPKA